MITTAPLLSKYLELSQQYDNLLATPTFPVLYNSISFGYFVYMYLG